MLFTKDIGIDLGTANTLVYLKGKGVVIREPSVVAVDVSRSKVVSVGLSAKEMIGRTPGSIVAAKPLRYGVISDFRSTEAMLRMLIKKSAGNGLFNSARVLIGVPSGATEVEKRAVYDVVKNAGAKKIVIVEKGLASAIGAKLPINEARANMIVDIGGGTTEVAVAALNDVVSSCSIKVAGDSFDEAITAYIKKKYSLLIGERTAEEIKFTIGSAFPYEGEGSMEVMGRNLIDGLPRSVEVASDEIRTSLAQPLFDILEAIKTTLEKAPPELAADIIEQGIVLTGGSAVLRGLDRLITKQTRIPVTVAKNPSDCVAEGLGKLLVGEYMRTPDSDMYYD